MSNILILEKIAVGKEGQLLFMLGYPVFQLEKLFMHKISYCSSYNQTEITNIQHKNKQYIISFRNQQQLKLNEKKIVRVISEPKTNLVTQQLLFDNDLPFVDLNHQTVILPTDLPNRKLTISSLNHEIETTPSPKSEMTSESESLPTNRKLIGEPQCIQIQKGTPHIIIDCEFGRRTHLREDKRIDNNHDIRKVIMEHGDYLLQLGAITYNEHNHPLSIFNRFIFDPRLDASDCMRGLKLSDLSYTQYVKQGLAIEIGKSFIHDVLAKDIPLGFWDATNDLTAIRNFFQEIYPSLTTKECQVLQKPMNYFDIANDALAYMHNESLTTAAKRPNLSLSSVGRLLGYQNKHPHHAVCDALLTGQIMHHLQTLNSRHLKVVDIPVLNNTIEESTQKASLTIVPKQHALPNVTNLLNIKKATKYDIQLVITYIQSLENHMTKPVYSSLSTLLTRYEKYSKIIEGLRAGKSFAEIKRSANAGKTIISQLKNTNNPLDALKQEILKTLGFYRGLLSYLPSHPELKTRLTPSQYSTLRRRQREGEQYLISDYQSIFDKSTDITAG